MDAKIGDWVVTPRSGKPVEIQALWYNALRIMEDLATRFSDDDRQKKYSNLASFASSTFNRVFWNQDAKCLYDVVNGGPPDGSIRPNQIFAVSLHHSMLSAERARAVVETVERELLTPVGLRTLSRTDPRYRGSYTGDQYSRDSAYHQGTVWPWLLGPFISAYVRVNGGTPQSRARAHELLRGIEQHLTEAGLGQISEIFDAEPSTSSPRLLRTGLERGRDHARSVRRRLSNRLGNDAANSRSRLTLQGLYLLVQFLRSLLSIAEHSGASAETHYRRDTILAEQFCSMRAHDHIAVITDVHSGIAIVHFIGDAGSRDRSAVLNRWLQQ